ncbi:hypothetical protein P8936_12150 [Edaphobacter paludis]|uniref:Major facilitator superfamily (MFS) profile domain-containing protein n=1 Tax=Edaphobacter paludis TaxID=3035702 RepID=A0AAU7D392_9BACT
MELLDAIADNALAIGISLLVGTLAAVLVFGAMFVLTAKLAAGIDFLVLVGLLVAGVVGVVSFAVTFRKIRSNH